MISVTRQSLEIFGFSLRWYGVLIACGAFLGIALADRRERRYGFEKDTVVTLALWALPAAVVAARVYYVLFRLDVYADNPLSIFNIREGGLAIYGGLIGGVIAGFAYSRAKKINFLALADLAAPSIALGQAVGRWGNFLNMEAYGARVSNEALMFFPFAVWIPAENGYFLATFFYESMWCFFIVFSYLFLERKGLFRFRGAGVAYYAAMYAFERSLVEGLRTDSLYLGSVRVSQALSLALLAAVCTALILRLPDKSKRRAPTIAALSAFLLLCLWVLGVFGQLPLLPAAAALLGACLYGIFSR